MSKIKKGLVFLVLQLIIFYVLPLFAGPTDTMGLVLMQFGATFVLSFIVGLLTKSEFKFVFPVLATVLFAPAIMLFYNNTAYIYLLFYAVITVGGVLVGTFLRNLFVKKE
ncbi:MAG: hypothetical protein IKU53_04745 [Firmicutes bacterium]|nr:hypothetical protein [Bacillota bacterium]